MKNVFNSLLNISILLCFVPLTQLNAQQTEVKSDFYLFEEVKIFSDTHVHSLQQHGIMVAGRKHLPFVYVSESQEIELHLYAKEKMLEHIRFLPQAGVEVLDSLLVIQGTHLRLLLRLHQISLRDLWSLTFVYMEDSVARNYQLPLFPYAKTKAFFYPNQDDLFIGEEKRFELLSNQIQSIRFDGEWITKNGYEYRLLFEEGRGYIDLIAHQTGMLKTDIEVPLRKPIYDQESSVLMHSISLEQHQLSVKGSRLSFLRFDQREVIRVENSREGFELQIDNHRGLQINKTYRIEDREEGGGVLIAELYTLRRLSNDKVLCVFRPYFYHKVTDGYMFIKDGDQPLFLTNINVLSEAKINKISILRNGGIWSDNLQVKPGEIVDIRIEGDALETARFFVEDLEDLSSDTLIRNEKVANYRLRVPLNIRKKQLSVFNFNKNTGFVLSVVEHQIPKQLDFVYVDYGDGERAVTSIHQPVFYNHTIRDIVLSFDEFAIDDLSHLYGKQFLEVAIRFLGPNDELIEMHTVDFLEICPGDNSPRFPFYATSSCRKSSFSVNALFSKKTHALEDWSKIEMQIQHKKTQYAQEGYSHKMIFVLQKRFTFDVDLSFPAGLLIQRVGDRNLPVLGGVSLAMIAQFSFYDKDKMRRLKPFKLGAGFLAQNAFNFNPEADRDLGIVAIASVFTTRKDRKLSFPMYAGFGYFIYEDRFFYLVGPGIRLSF